MSSKQLTVNQCQFQNARGQRCNMLIDTNHRHGTGPATLCTFHAERLRAKIPLVDPEVLAAELLTDINSFTPADEVNLFLGTLVRQLARRRIARRDAIALAYMSQLILTSQTAMAKEIEAEVQAAKDAENNRLIASLYQRRRTPASLDDNQQSAAAAEQTANDSHRPA